MTNPTRLPAMHLLSLEKGHDPPFLVPAYVAAAFRPSEHDVCQGLQGPAGPTCLDCSTHCWQAL